MIRSRRAKEFYRGGHGIPTLESIESKLQSMMIISTLLLTVYIALIAGTNECSEPSWYDFYHAITKLSSFGILLVGLSFPILMSMYVSFTLESFKVDDYARICHWYRKFSFLIHLSDGMTFTSYVLSTVAIYFSFLVNSCEDESTIHFIGWTCFFYFLLLVVVCIHVASTHLKLNKEDNSSSSSPMLPDNALEVIERCNSKANELNLTNEHLHRLTRDELVSHLHLSLSEAIDVEDYLKSGAFEDNVDR